MEETRLEDKDSKKRISKEKKAKHSKSNNKKNIIIISIIIAVIFISIILFSTIFALLNINNSNIVSGIKVAGIELSGLSLEEAKSKIELIYSEKKIKDIYLKYQEYEATINAELLETNYDIETAIKEAISVGKDKNIFLNNYNILLALMGKKEIKVNMTVNEEIARQKIEDIGANLPGVVIEPGYVIEKEDLIITNGKKGVKIDTEKLLEQIKYKLSNISDNENYIEIPVIEKVPEKIDIDKIHEEVYKEVKDAYYTKDPFTIYPEAIGVDFNVEEAKALLEAEDKEQYTIKLKITNPSVTTADIGSEAFPDQLATFSTRYDAYNVDRTTNLKLACQKINNKVVLPGEIFSYNQTLGERSTSAGYKNAKVYENGEVVDGIGGGICQISSTLYNSVLIANMDIIERRNHQFVTSYTPAGRDATVVYGLTDFKFKNTREYAVKIQASVSNGIATVSIYGIKSENEYSVSFNTKQISTIPFTVKYIDDNTLPVGTEKIKQNGANGVITETYIIKSLNGKVVSSKLLSKDTYSAMQKIILRGTKGAATSTNINSSNNTGITPSTSSGSNTGTVSDNPSNVSDTTSNNKPLVETNMVTNITEENKETKNNI